MTTHKIDANDVEKIAEALRRSSERDNSAKRIVDSINKVMTGLCLAGTMWLIGTMTAIDKKMAQNDIAQSNFEKSIGELKVRLDSFTAQPRFTQQDFNTQIALVVEKVDQNSRELLERGPRIDSLANKVVILEQRIESYYQNRRYQLKQPNNFNEGF